MLNNIFSFCLCYSCVKADKLGLDFVFVAIKTLRDQSVLALILKLIWFLILPAPLRHLIYLAIGNLVLDYFPFPLIGKLVLNFF